MAIKVSLKIKSPKKSSEIEKVVNGSSDHFVGRESEWLAIEDPTVSRKHFAFRESSDGSLEIVDLKSRSGVEVNGKKVTSAKLHVGDKICVGTTFVTIAQLHLAFDKVSAKAPVAKAPLTSGIKQPQVAPLVQKHEEESDADEKPDYLSLPNFKNLMGFYEKALFSPKEFFANTHFDGPIAQSVVVNVVASLIAFFVIPFAFGARYPSSALIYLVFIAFASVIMHSVFYAARTLIGSSASLSQFLRFAAYASLIQIVVGASTAVLGLLSIFLSLAALVWYCYGLKKVLGASLIRTFLVCVVFSVISALFIPRGMFKPPTSIAQAPVTQAKGFIQDFAEKYAGQTSTVRSPTPADESESPSAQETAPAVSPNSDATVVLGSCLGKTMQPLPTNPPVNVLECIEYSYQPNAVLPQVLEEGLKQIKYPCESSPDHSWLTTKCPEVSPQTNLPRQWTCKLKNYIGTGAIIYYSASTLDTVALAREMRGDCK